MLFGKDLLCQFRRDILTGFSVFGALVCVGLFFFPAEDASAQQMTNMSADQLMQLQQQAQQGRGNTGGQSLSSQETILEPNAAPNPQLPTSRLEQILSNRAGTKLTQFGYDQMGSGRSVTLPQMGAVQDDYILGPGDEVVVSLRGQENSEYRVTVDRDGRIVLPRLNPVSASGRTLQAFRQELVAAIHRAYVSTEGFVSVGKLRQISVLVSGEVGSPGVRTLTGLSTAVDAILISGGIKKTGSLRNIHILRGGREITVDLYSVLTGHSASKHTALADGDRIIVPPLGSTAAVAGWVRRPGIYEIAAGRSSVGVQELLALAGGLEVRGQYHLSILSVARDGRNQMTALEGQREVLRDSEILFAQPAADQTVNRATLAGGSPLAGQYAAKTTKLSKLLKSPGALGENPYTLIGLISRRDPVTKLRTLRVFTPVAVLKGSEDLDLQSDDIVRVFSIDESRVILAAVQQYGKQRAATEEATRSPQAADTAEGTTQGAAGAANTAAGSSGVAAAVLAKSGGEKEMEFEALKSANIASNSVAADLRGDPQQQGTPPGKPGNLDTQIDQKGIASNVEVARIDDLAKQLYVDPLVLINFLQDHSTNVDGAIRGPGLYLIGPNADIQSLIEAAGGVTQWADRTSIEVISTHVDTSTGNAQTERITVSLADASSASMTISPHDSVRIHEVFTKVGVGAVTVQGEVRQVGSYQIVRGEHLSDVLMRAGGLTESAYPYGTVFLRRSIAAIEQDSFRRSAQAINDQLLLGISRTSSDTKLSPEVFVALQGYVNQLRNQKALGRMTVTADPAVLAANPAADPLLEAGDIVYVPKRPYAVSVMGEVLQQNSVPYQPGLSAAEYIDRAGGFSQFADKSEVFVVLPNGSARRVESSWFDFVGSDDIPPGSAVYVGRDIAKYDLRQTIVDVTSIFSTLATTAAALAVLSTNMK
jgi:polysaccharide biosynthesis/export protein